AASRAAHGPLQVLHRRQDSAGRARRHPKGVGQMVGEGSHLLGAGTTGRRVDSRELAEALGQLAKEMILYDCLVLGAVFASGHSGSHGAVYQVVPCRASFWPFHMTDPDTYTEYRVPGYRPPMLI